MDLILDVASLGQLNPYPVFQVIGRIGAAGKVAKAIQKGMRGSEVKAPKGEGNIPEGRGDHILPGQGNYWVKLKGDQGWKYKKDNTIWKKDKLHKDH